MASADILRAAHSPLPWSVKAGFAGAVKVVYPDPKYSKLLHEFIECCDGGIADPEANAAFIVRACNAHYQMLEALKQAQAALAMMVSPHVIGNTSSGQAWAACFEADVKARAAIAAAEAEAGH